LTFVDAVRDAFRRYSDFDGRSSRSAYWFFWLFWYGVAMLLAVVAAPGEDQAGEPHGVGLVAYVLFVIFAFATLLPAWSLTFRRLHDTNRSGWNYLWTLTIVGWIPVLIWLCSAGRNQANRYGAPALTAPADNRAAGASPERPAITSAEAARLANLEALERLGRLHASGVLTEEEFAAQKARILGAA
jgi:uncharacterized membrane protein YhaH (DUF805 family)